MMSSRRPATAIAAPPARATPRVGTWALVVVAAAVAAAGGGLWARHRGREAGAAGGGDPRGRGPAAAGAAVARVEVTRPRPGGIARVVDQVASVHAYEFADVFAQVSGYLRSQTVDFGDLVKAGAEIARIDVPTQQKRVEQAEATLAQSRAKVEQARAAIETAKARLEATRARVQQAEAEVGGAVAERVYRNTELERITGLAGSGSVERKLVDETRQRSQAALAAEEAKKSAVVTSRAEVLAAAAGVTQAEADLAEARSRVGITQADLDASRVIVDFATIRAPYDGVVTRRSFFPGAFIRAAEEGGAVPLFSIARQDMVRIATQVDDRYVAYLSRGDDAVVRLDGLPGREFRGKVSRFASAEDPASRLMYTEIDLPNPDGLLKDGMYGRVLINVAPSKAGLSIPSSCLMEKSGPSAWVVYVARDGRARRAVVGVGADNGVEVEVLDGLSPRDEVVAAVNGAISDGAAVESVPYVGRKGNAAPGRAPSAR